MRDEIKYRSDLSALSQQTRQQIERDLERLNETLAAGRPIKLRLGDDHGTEIVLSVATIELIREALMLGLDGKSLLLLEESADVSPEKAAEMLRISRPTLLKKLDNGEIPFHYVVSHRRIAVVDVLAYRSKQKERAQAALQQMRDSSDEMGIYE
ncbi:MAG: helix-turn-helix domain-containing protein [Acidobacteria bacterium]|nr:helix-turn-helix domain-containing protein [Acidobacteriota bacterium]